MAYNPLMALFPRFSMRSKVEIVAAFKGTADYNESTSVYVSWHTYDCGAPIRIHFIRL